MIRTPSTPASMISRTPVSIPGGQKSREEKIFVTVRVRPLSQKEQALKDQVAWDCRDGHTIFPKSNNQDRSCGPYCFDRVFDPSCTTQKVYDEGARDVALSALTGINATIFAYGQTSSGKTFTMRGITENAVKDIFEHIRSTPERDFDIKFSALEIYNETVIDLLNRGSGPLQLVDDPEKGIIVEKQVEEVAKDSQRLKSLIGICEAQRQVGETALNDTSSRSHLIIKLTVESSLREHSGAVKSYIASLNLVDLAGSERASQTNVDSMRLKEGSHINRSLLTLMTVIRKLSSVRKRSGHIHIPYRDSKLTRILQPSLGGNSRTAIICTMSPALSQIGQSRNTLSFASSAKEVTNRAKVNMVVAEKQLVRQLQNQVARLKAERRSPEPSSLCLKSQLREKDMEIQQMKLEMEELKCQKDMEILQMKLEMKELKRQRDLAQSELDLERKLSKKQKVRNLHTLERVAKLQYQKQLLVGQVLELEENDSSACETELQEQKVRNLLTLKERVAKLQYQKQLLVDQVLELEKIDSACETELQEQKVRNLLTLKERVAKLQYQKQLLVDQVLELEENDSSACETEIQEQSPLSWHLLFEEQRKQIIVLWHLCHVSIVHRSQFYLLFRGALDDKWYMEVELRRLIWLEQQLAEVGNASPALLGDEPASSVTSRIRTLKQEREQLSKWVTSRLSPQELEMLFIKWDIPPDGKQRRLQLVNKLWTDPHNMDHIQDSAEVVAKLAGFCESSKEMFQLNFVSPSDKKPWMGWNLISNLLNF